jgi:hypothetical protein
MSQTPSTQLPLDPQVRKWVRGRISNGVLTVRMQVRSGLALMHQCGVAEAPDQLAWCPVLAQRFLASLSAREVADAAEGAQRHHA